MKVGFIGLGKLGLPVAETMAERYQVIGYDTAEVKANLVKITNDILDTVKDTDITFVAVPTPHDVRYDGSHPTSHLENKDFDYGSVIDVFRRINGHVNPNGIMVLISTVLPGTIRKQLASELSNVELIYNPYLIAMGTVAYDFANPEMVMIGSENGMYDDKILRLVRFYESLMSISPRIVVGTWEEMECTKLFYNCYSQDTEVMTSSGWKLFPDVSDADEILSLNPEENTPEWVKPNKIVGRYHSGKMIHFTSSKDDVLVTEEHNMYVGSSVTRDKVRSHRWELLSAKDVIQRNYYAFIRSTNWHDLSPTHIDLGFGRLPTDLYVRFMAWYLSEGCVSNGRVIISQDRNRNPEKHAMVKSMLDEIKIQLSCKNMVCESDTGCSILDGRLSEYLHVFGKSHDKHVPVTIKNLGQSMIRLFLDCYNLADGSSMPFRSFNGKPRGDNNVRRYKYYATSSDRMSSDIGELIIKVGRFPSYRKMLSPISGNDCHLIYELLQKTSIFSKHSSRGLKHNVMPNYDGMVYCAMLPRNHVFMTRRNGKCTWQGNTFISTKLCLVNMMQDVAERVGFVNVDVVADALAGSTNRITGPAYMKPGMGDGGPCHPRDNIALRHLAERLDIGYDLFDGITKAREMQAENLAKELIRHRLPVIILGKSFKPGVPYTDGSYSVLVGHYVEEMGGVLSYDHVSDEPATYLLGHNVVYDGYEFAKGSVIVDPWRNYRDRDGLTVINYGDTRETGPRHG